VFLLAGPKTVGSLSGFGSSETEEGGKIRNDLGMEFVYIYPGSFIMGSSEKEAERDVDERQHRVTLTKGFYMQTTEVTERQWRFFVRETGYRSEAETSGGAYYWTGEKWEKNKNINWKNPGFTQGENDPVTCVSWNDAEEFIEWISKRDGQRYSLPTEAQWEYAARAGTTTPFAFGKCLSSDQANYDGNYPMSGCSKGNYRKETTPVASFPANEWGLHDMNGNVWEWCSDWYGEYPSGEVTDPSGPNSGSERVLRGGSWYDDASNCRAPDRYRGRPSDLITFTGFRLVRLPGY
jgi:formylglycine-generating enzyme required for sulfatase activity